MFYILHLNILYFSYYSLFSNVYTNLYLLYTFLNPSSSTTRTEDSESPARELQFALTVGF